MNNIRTKTFATKLCELYEVLDLDDFNVENYSSELMSAFYQLGEGSTFQDRCMQILEFGSAPSNFDTNVSVYGFKLKNKEVFVSALLNTLERIQIPDEVKERFPNINQEEWQACIRLATLVLAAFTPYKANKQ